MSVSYKVECYCSSWLLGSLKVKVYGTKLSSDRPVCVNTIQTSVKHSVMLNLLLIYTIT